MLPRLIIRLLACVFLAGGILASGGAHAQNPLVTAATAEDEPPAVELPVDLTSEQIDGLLARMTDADIRRLLAEELHRRADAQSQDEMAAMDFVDFASMRLVEMQSEIGERLPRWFKAVANLSDRHDEVAKRIATADHGPWGMLLAALVIVAVGAGAGALTARMTR
ncbi:MAG: hypothetical protein AAF317_17990, partial [Pseudomonadota bacterium]